MSPCIPSCISGLRLPGLTQHPGGGLCLQSCLLVAHASFHGSLSRATDPCHPLCMPTRLKAGPGTDTRPHGHTGVCRSPSRDLSGVSSPQPQLGTMPTVTHLTPSLCCSWDLPQGETETLRTSKPLELGLCSTHEPLATLGNPRCSSGYTDIVRSHIQPPNHGQAPLSPAHRASVGRGRSRSAPPCPSRWILSRAHAAPCQTISAQSLSVPRALTALQHHLWLAEGAGAGC